jgi:hypothetical protein
LAELTDEHGETLPHGAAPAQLEVENVGSAGVGGAHKQEHPGASEARGGNEGFDGITAHERIDGGDIDSESADRTERSLRPPHGEGRNFKTAEERLRVGDSGDVDVTALAIGDDEQTVGASVIGDGDECRRPWRSESLEAGELELDCKTGRCDCIDEREAVAKDGPSDPRDILRAHKAGVLLPREAFRATPNPRPERGRMRIEAEHDLRLTLGDTRREGVAKERQVSVP